MNQKIRVPAAVIFDLDGVLLDTESLYTQASRRVVERYGQSFSLALKSQTMGRDARDGAALVIDELKLPLDVDDYLSQRRAHLVELFVDVPALPGARQWVDIVRKASLPVAIATSSSRSLCELKWASHSWIQSISPIVCGDDAAVKRLKPAPDIYLEVARQIKMKPADCLVFEDSPAGVQAALRAGMQVVAIKARELAAEQVSDATLVVSGYEEITLSTIGLT